MLRTHAVYRVNRVAADSGGANLSRSRAGTDGRADTVAVVTDEAVPTTGARTTVVALLAYAELRGMEALARGAGLAPDVPGRIAMLEFAGERYDRHRHWCELLTGTGAEAMAAVARPVDEFHARTEARSWPEMLVSLYAGFGLAEDFLGGLEPMLGTTADGPDGSVREPSAATGFAVGRIRDLVADEPRLAGRLTLWGRRVVGEAMTQAQRLVADEPAVAGLLTGTEAGPDLAAASGLFGALLSRHNLRMAELEVPA